MRLATSPKALAVILLLIAMPMPVRAELLLSQTLVHEGTTREYDLYVPDNPGIASLPLVLDIHGYNSTSALYRFASDFTSLAESEKFIVAYPNGLESRWNAVPGAAGTDDLGFMLALVSRLSGEYDIDQERIYASGFSQGGVMAYRLGCEAAEVFAAIATVAGGVVTGSESHCQPGRPLPVLSFRGDTDGIMPYGGGPVQVVMPMISVLSAADTLTFWRTRGSCVGPVQRQTLGAMSFCDSDRQCSNGAVVSMCTVRGAEPSPYHTLYNNADGLDLNRMIWEFFREHSLQDVGGVFQINAGISDAWYFPDTAGQGFFIVVFPQLKQLFVAWFTYDTQRPANGVTAILGEPGHRWLTAQGPYEGDTALLDLYLTEGGTLDSAAPPPQSRLYGELEIVFENCESGTIHYDLPAVGRSGSIPIQRIVSDNVAGCQELATR